MFLRWSTGFKLYFLGGVLVALAGVIWLALKWWRKPVNENDDALLPISGLFSLVVVIFFLFVVSFSVWKVSAWYFVVYRLSLPLCLACLEPPVLKALPRLARSPLLQKTPLFALVLVIWGLIAVNQFINVRRANGIVGNQPAIYRAALWADENLPQDAVLSNLDSGVIAYFSQRRTINLDGLINSYDYQSYLQRGELDVFLRENQVGYYSAITSEYDQMLRDYTCVRQPVWSGMYHHTGGEIELCLENEIKRVEYRHAGGDWAYIIWRIAP